MNTVTATEKGIEAEIDQVINEMIAEGNDNYATLLDRVQARLEARPENKKQAEFAQTTINQPSKPDKNPINTRQKTEPNPPNPGNPGTAGPCPAQAVIRTGEFTPPTPATPATPSTPIRSPHEPAFGPRGFLNDLPSHLQDQIDAMLDRETYDAAIKLLAKPAPQGIGRVVSPGALQRFSNRRRVREQRENIDALAAEARAMIQNPAVNDPDLTRASIRLIRAQLLEFAVSQSSFNFNLTERLIRMQDRIRRADLAERRLDMAAQRKGSP